MADGDMDMVLPCQALGSVIGKEDNPPVFWDKDELSVGAGESQNILAC